MITLICCVYLTANDCWKITSTHTRIGHYRRSLISYDGERSLLQYFLQFIYTCSIEIIQLFFIYRARFCRQLHQTCPIHGEMEYSTCMSRMSASSLKCDTFHGNDMHDVCFWLNCISLRRS